MNSKSKRLVLILVLVLGLLWVWSVASAQGGNPTVPLKGRFTGAGAEFSGQMTHLGRFEGVIDNSDDTPTADWTAANGDTISNETTSFVIDFTAPVGDTVYPYEQTLTITGGSGRFAEASGSASVSGLIDVATFEYDGQLEGSLSW